MIAKSRWNVVFAILWLLVAGGLAVTAFSTTRLACTRIAGEMPNCTFVRSGPLPRTVAFPPGAISAVEVAKRMGNKKSSAPRFAVLLLDQRGAEVEVARFDSAERAHALRDEVRAFLDDRARTTYVRETVPRAGAYLLPAGALAVGIGLLVYTLGRARRERVGQSASAPTPFDVTVPGPLEPQPAALGDGPRIQLHGARPWVLGLAGLCLFAGVGTLLLFEYANRHQGAVEIRAESRCRFGGTELLPGAAMSLHLEPGRHSFEVYNSRVPGNWEVQAVDVRLGETASVRCVPLQR